MLRNMKRTAACVLALGLAVTSLAGCSKKDKFDAAKTMLSVKNGSSLDAGTANLILRYQQAEFENGIGQIYKSWYGLTDIWNTDLTGSGEAYGNAFKEQVLEDLEHMLLDEKHAADYDVSLSDDEKKAISEAAKSFIESNDAEVLEKMSATQESAERMLTLYTIRHKVEEAMTADVDTEVSDEEAAQRRVHYVQFSAETEAEEEVTEGESEGVSENGESVAESAGDEAALETETEVKTKSASETEVEEAATEEVGENAPAESVSEAGSEGETESEDPAMAAARLAAQRKAEAFLDSVKDASAEDFESAASELASNDTSVYSSEYTFGDDDTYPDTAIIEATKGLEDNTLVDYPVQVADSWYVLYVEDAFDEEATAEKKDEIVEQRKDDAIKAVYDEWANSEDEAFEIDGTAWTSLIFNIALNYETEASTEALSESVSEGASESVAEFVTE